MEVNLDDIDVGLALVRYAEIVAKQRGLAPWSIVGSILSRGSTTSMAFCAAHMPKMGWQPVGEKPPFDTDVLACEELGDPAHKMRYDGQTWHRVRRGKTEPVSYSPRWWRAIT